MSMEAEIRTILTNVQLIDGHVGDRIRCGMLDQGETLPAITYSRVASGQAPTTSGPSDYEEALITISVWANTLAEAIEIDRDVVRVLEDSENWATFDNAIAGSDRHLLDGETRKHRVERDWRFFGTSHPTGD